MGSNNPVTWLDKLEEQLNVDVDWMDPEYIKSMQPFKFHDQTSNQLWVDIQLGDESNKDLLAQTAKELKDKGWLAIYTRMAVLMCKKNIDMISGRVLLQTLPSKAYDTQATLDHARLYDQEFARAGISRDRFCIKIPSTGPALNAAKILSAEGIPTLGTALFGLPQAIACSQAGMLYISPYFNETRAHDELKLWPDVEDPATQHPMSARIVQILETYKKLYKETGKEQPLLKNASFITAKEAMAAGELGCHSATISHTVLNELAKLQYDGSKQPGEGVPKPVHVYKHAGPTPARLQKLAKIDPLAAADWDGKLASTDIDYLANGGEELAKAIAKDPIATTRLKDALELFTGGEERSKAKVEAVLKTL
ncbi:putative transaldolase protein [Phaeoacremonium minimum UCRPA7]|uniref:Putative transaldolase protein n=1 Tax=Phaeoacremonium minimum (strain UCR-PA7) TaxID=1286976 RepID=R8BST2_PHAM7|nr:putative transaldolase protein [Phaeoacremonium minimum UCRPA7]EOO02401.1 putative transaldolase protein [Phaeoacremonium minimum UCRPA7]